MVFRAKTAENYPRSFRGKKMTSENESRLWRRLEEKTSVVNCALDFKYFDMPEIWPRVPPDAASTSCVNIYDRLSLSPSLSRGANLLGVECCCVLHGVFRFFSY